MLTKTSFFRRSKIMLEPDVMKVVLRPFIPNDDIRITKIIGRIMSLSEPVVKREIKVIIRDFSKRHVSVESTMLRHYELVRSHVMIDSDLSSERKLLIGAYFTNEYSTESAALFNPSIIPHPDQSGIPSGNLRFIMSLRATGEGHISSLAFRTGIIDENHSIEFDPRSRYTLIAPQQPNATYDKKCFRFKLAEMGFDNELVRTVLDALPDPFTLDKMSEHIRHYVHTNHRYTENDRLTQDKMNWLALSNYEVCLDPNRNVSEYVIFPASPAEQNGIEDVRFVQFQDDTGEQIYYATYTAYDGKVILPALLETRDFIHFKMITLNGKAVQNKGMALFPRKINGKYAMLSRQDSESIFIMYSDNIHFWQQAIPLVKPLYSWEFMQLGNCGSPIETDQGWLVLTHGVGAMRRYCIGAILLDIEDPAKVIGRLREPLIIPIEREREGYVPNVVYTCGSLIHGEQLVIPYAVSDSATTIAFVDLPELLQRLTS